MKVKLYDNKIAYFEWQGTFVYCMPDVNISDLPFIEISNPPQDFLENYKYYNYLPEYDEYYFNEQFKAEEDYLKLVEEIRQRRQTECFSVIDKSQLWYDRLTKKQHEQLDEWYKAWLKAPETLTIPAKPKWL